MNEFDEWPIAAGDADVLRLQIADFLHGHHSGTALLSLYMNSVPHDRNANEHAEQHFLKLAEREQSFINENAA